MNGENTQLGAVIDSSKCSVRRALGDSSISRNAEPLIHGIEYWTKIDLQHGL